MMMMPPPQPFCLRWAVDRAWEHFRTVLLVTWNILLEKTSASVEKMGIDPITLSYAKRALYHLSYIPVVNWWRLANLNSKLLFIKEILQLVSLLENRQSLTSWKFIVDVPCHGLVGTKFNHPSPSSCREGSKPSTAGATHSQKSSDTKRHQNRSCAHTLTDRSAYIYIWVVNAVVTVLVFLGLTVQVFRFLQIYIYILGVNVVVTDC